jgi:hypothetical protein
MVIASIVFCCVMFIISIIILKQTKKLNDYTLALCRSIDLLNIHEQDGITLRRYPSADFEKGRFVWCVSGEDFYFDIVKSPEGIYTVVFFNDLAPVKLNSIKGI